MKSSIQLASYSRKPSRAGVGIMMFLCLLILISTLLFVINIEPPIILFTPIYFIPIIIALTGTFVVLIELKIRKITQYRIFNHLMLFIMLTFLSALSLPSLKWILWHSITKSNIELIEIHNKTHEEIFRRPDNYKITFQSQNISGEVHVSEKFFNKYLVGDKITINYKKTVFGIFINYET